MDRQIKDLLQAGLIEPSHSPYASPIVCVAKHDSSIRICCDYRDINSGTIDCVFPMKNAQDMLMKIGHCAWITYLDCSQGFYQIRMHPNSIEKTAFVKHAGQFQWRVMSFGLKNVSSTFQNVKNEILKPHNSYAEALIDDITIFSKTFDDHIMHVNAVLADLKANGITLKPSKSQFVLNEVKCVGHIVGNGTHRPCMDKVLGIKTIPRPITKKQLQSVLGLMGYY